MRWLKYEATKCVKCFMDHMLHKYFAVNMLSSLNNGAIVIISVLLSNFAI